MLVGKRLWMVVGGPLVVLVVVVWATRWLAMPPLFSATRPPNGMTPEGEWIAFSCAAGGVSELYLMRPDGSQITQVTDLGRWSINPRWSPDGQWLAFNVWRRDGVTRRRLTTDIYKVRSDGSQLHQLTPDFWSELDPDWSPDGAWIVFSSAVRKTLGIYRMRPDGGQMQALAHLGRDYSGVGYPLWSPDGTWVSFVVSDWRGNRHLWRMRGDGGNLERGDSPLPSPQFAWSPDGTQVAFAHTGTGTNISVYVAAQPDTALATARNLTGRGASYIDPTWSPDGQWLAFVKFNGRSTDQLYKIRADGRHLTQLTTGNCAPGSPDWHSFAAREPRP
jgi:Tol biopolymer transport system component